MLMRPMFHAVEQHCPAFWLQSQEVLIYSPRSAGGHCYHPHRRSIPQSLDIMGAHVHEMIMHDHSKYGIGLDSRLACTYSSRRQHALSLKLRASCPRTSAPSLRNMVKHCETCIYGGCRIWRCGGAPERVVIAFPCICSFHILAVAYGLP